MAIKISHLKTDKETKDFMVGGRGGRRLGMSGFEDYHGLHVLENSDNTTLVISPYSLKTVRVFVKDVNGKMVSVVGGLETFEQYLDHDNAFLGSTIARAANRHTDYTTPSGVASRLIMNEKDRGVHLHDGPRGSEGSFWGFNGQSVSSEIPCLEFALDLEDGNGGHPGNVLVKAVVSLDESGIEHWKYSTLTDQDTLFIPTNHNYMNPGGADKALPLDDVLLSANWTHRIRVNDRLLPDGADGKELVKNKKGSKHDFSTARTIGSRYGEGYDTCYGRVDEKPVETVLYDRGTGIAIITTTGPKNRTQQFYSAGGLDINGLRKNGFACLEVGGGIDPAMRPKMCKALGIEPWAYAAHPERNVRTFTRQYTVMPK